jgi:hypothetical protein
MQGLRAACLLWVINTSRDVRVMSVIPLKADIHLRGLHVCLVPRGDICRCNITVGLFSSGHFPAMGQPRTNQAVCAALRGLAVAVGHRQYQRDSGQFDLAFVFAA